MALFTSTPVSMIPKDRQSAGSAKAQAADLKASSRSVQDATAQRLFTQSGSAVQSLQEQVDAIMTVLRGDIPQPESYAVTDPSGNLIAWIGYNVVNNVVYQGGWFRQFYVGGTNASNAVISSDAAGNVTINGATITLIGPNGVILLDPTVPAITVSDSGGNQWAALEIIKEAPQNITAATNASPVVVTLAAHGYTNGDTVIVAGATGNTAINGYRIVKNATTNTFTMTDIAGAAINGNGAFSGTTTATRYYAGGLFESIAIGPSWAGAKLRGYADGSLKITDAEITLNGSAAAIDLDPTQGRITVTSTSLNATSVVIEDGILISDANENQAQMANGVYQASATGITALAASEVVTVNGYTGATQYGPVVSLTQYRGTPSLATATQSGDTLGGIITWGFDGIGESAYAAGIRAVATQNHGIGAHGANLIFEVTPNGSSATAAPMTLNQDGTLNVASGYKFNGVAGISTTRSFGTSLTVSTIANGLRGTPGAGQSNLTLVTGVTLNLTPETIGGGIVTA